MMCETTKRAANWQSKLIFENPISWDNVNESKQSYRPATCSSRVGSASHGSCPHIWNSRFGDTYVYLHPRFQNKIQFIFIIHKTLVEINFLFQKVINTTSQYCEGWSHLEEIAFASSASRIQAGGSTSPV